MKAIDCVTEFRACYLRWHQHVFAAGPGSRGTSKLSKIAERLRLHDAGLSVSDVEGLEKRVLSNRLPDSYRYFLVRMGFNELRLPLVEFPETLPPTGVMSVEHGFLVFAGKPFVAIARTTTDEGHLGFPIVNDKVVDEIHVGEVNPDGSLSQTGPVFGSFCGMLSVLRGYLEAPQSELAEPSSSESRPLYERLRKLDPSGFGGPGWELWWKKRLLKKRVEF